MQGMILSQPSISVGTTVDHYAVSRAGEPAVFQGQALVVGTSRNQCYRLEVNRTYFDCHASMAVPTGQLLPARWAWQTL